MPAAPSDLSHIAPVVYAYGPVKGVPDYLHTQLLTFLQRSSKPNDCIRENTIRLFPQAAGLPYRSSFTLIRQSRFWKSSLEETIKVLELLAEDNTTTDTEVGNGITPRTSRLQHHVNATIMGIEKEGADGGNGGKEMLDAIRDSFRCVHPEADSQTVQQYLEFRRLNVGAR